MHSLSHIILSKQQLYYQNSSGESKLKVFKRICEKLLPIYHKKDPNAYKRVKGKWEK